MPIKHSPPARKTRSQARDQAVLTPTPGAPLDGTPAVLQLRANLDRGPIVEGAEPSRKEGGPRRSSSFSGISRTTFKGPGGDGKEEEENSVEEEDSDGTEGVPAPSEPSSVAIIQQMTHIMANIQAASSSEASRPPDFKTPSMKLPECFDGTETFKVKSFI
ncbi:hypothetical protein O181_088181 [Austropuccinia psidii MF-1]|uniref:Uncharacterized protein n=1 Tax=Austropuccinia psidii MF-1 TaxID=1389203 RepID=A0A9Q3P6P8_9BASI|nr:hypothetical protein [Austropuccinia psidii MF-1]